MLASSADEVQDMLIVQQPCTTELVLHNDTERYSCVCQHGPAARKCALSATLLASFTIEPYTRMRTKSTCS
jgi:hypothetical protein